MALPVDTRVLANVQRSQQRTKTFHNTFNVQHHLSSLSIEVTSLSQPTAVDRRRASVYLLAGEQISRLTCSVRYVNFTIHELELLCLSLPFSSTRLLSVQAQPAQTQAPTLHTSSII